MKTTHGGGRQALVTGALLAPLLAVTAGCSRRISPEEARGQALFTQRCALCHTTGAEGAQGPGLGGVVGRKAAGNPAFGNYSAALRSSGLTWNRETLDRFLAGPALLVPGTRMAIAVESPDERTALIAYLGSLAAGTGPKGTKRSSGSYVPVPPAPPSSRVGAAAFTGYRDDGPGVRHRILPEDLPAPNPSESARRPPSVIPRPPGAELHVPPGFHVAPFATDLDAPRLLRVAPNGDVFVAESDAGRIRVLRAEGGATRATRVSVFASDLSRPFGIAFYPPGPSPQWVYVAETNAVVRFPYTSGDLVAGGRPQTIVPKLTATAGGHWTRDVAFSPDGQQMFVSIGSASNVADEMPRDPPEPIAAWQASHGLGAAWGDEEHRADVRVMSPDGHGLRTWATGIRNCVGLKVDPKGALWCATNERDGLGDNLVPDYVTRVRDGGYYGWPWFYIGGHEEPRKAGQRPDLAHAAIVPDVLLQPHSAALGLVFYEGEMFPAAYRDQIFVTLHGSWNRSNRTGYKVVRVVMADGHPTGEYEDFLTGFVADDDDVWGRPVGIDVARDGALLVSEDGNGTVWRVAWAAPADAAPPP